MQDPSENEDQINELEIHVSSPLTTQSVDEQKPRKGLKDRVT